MHIGKAVVYLVYRRQGTGLDIGHQTFDFALRSNQAGNIHPFPAPDRCIRKQTLADFLIASELNLFQTLDDRVSQELMDSRFVELNAFI